MKKYPITKFEACLRLIVVYVPFIVLPLYFEDEMAFVLPALYFGTGLWFLPLILFTGEREETDAASQIMRNGLKPLYYLMLVALAGSAVLFMLSPATFMM